MPHPLAAELDAFQRKRFPAARMATQLVIRCRPAQRYPIWVNPVIENAEPNFRKGSEAEIQTEPLERQKAGEIQPAKVRPR
jgi:hypothetical protein